MICGNCGTPDITHVVHDLCRDCWQYPNNFTRRIDFDIMLHVGMQASGHLELKPHCAVYAEYFVFVDGESQVIGVITDYQPFLPIGNGRHIEWVARLGNGRGAEASHGYFQDAFESLVLNYIMYF